MLHAFIDAQSMTVSYQVAHCYHAWQQDTHAAITHPIATSTMKLVNFSPESRIQAQSGAHQLHDARRLVPGGQREELLYIAHNIRDQLGVQPARQVMRVDGTTAMGSIYGIACRCCYQACVYRRGHVPGRTVRKQGWYQGTYLQRARLLHVSPGVRRQVFCPHLAVPAIKQNAQAYYVRCRTQSQGKVACCRYHPMWVLQGTSNDRRCTRVRQVITGRHSRLFTREPLSSKQNPPHHTH
jgi:hypothetical protein